MSFNQEYRFAGVLIPILIIAGCGGAPDSSQEITFSHILNPESEWHAGAARFKELVEAKTAGSDSPTRVSLFTSASLSGKNQQTELDNVQSGGLVMTWESSILLSTLDPAWSVYSLPWLLDDYEDAETLCEGPLGREMLERLQEKRLIGLGYGFNGFRQLTNGRHPVLRPEDLSGLRIRVPSIEMYVSLFERWDAKPSSMNFGELIPALRSGAMDGQENPLHVIEAAKLNEVQKYLSVWQYSFDPLVMCVNQEWWTAQSPELQKVLRDCAIEACAYQRGIVRERETEHLTALRKAGMEISVLTAGQREAFRRSAEGLYETYREIIGSDLQDRFVAEAKRLREMP